MVEQNSSLHAVFWNWARHHYKLGVAKMFYSLYPEVSGGFGDNVVYDPATRHVSHLHYEFDGWLGDDILQTSPCCYIVTERLKDAISKIAGSGYFFAHVEISTSDQFRELYPNRDLPPFWWLQVSGQPGKDDFGLSANNCLVVSERVLAAMRQNCQLEECEISEYG